MWDTATKQEIASFKVRINYLAASAFSPDGNLLAIGSLDNTVKLWNVRLKQQVASLKGHESNVNSVAFSPDGNTLVSVSQDKTVRFWCAATGAEIGPQ